MPSSITLAPYFLKRGPLLSMIAVIAMLVVDGIGHLVDVQGTFPFCSQPQYLMRVRCLDIVKTIVVRGQCRTVNLNVPFGVVDIPSSVNV